MARKTKRRKVKRAKVSQRKPAPAKVESPTTEAGATPQVQQAITDRVRANVPMPELAVPVLPIGVYFTTQAPKGRTAIVYRVGKHHVHVVTMGALIEAKVMSASEFTKEYGGRWPAYPLRRAARIYLQSGVEKSADALRVLRSLVVL